QGTSVGHRDTPHSGVTQETHTDVPSNTRTSWRAEESSKLSDFDAVMSTGKSTSRHREKSKTDCALNMPEYMHYTTRGNIAHGTVPCTGTPSTTVPNGSRRFTPARLRLEDGRQLPPAPVLPPGHTMTYRERRQRRVTHSGGRSRAGRRVSGGMVRPRSESTMSIARRLCWVSSFFALMTHQRAVLRYQRA